MKLLSRILGSSRTVLEFVMSLVSWLLAPLSKVVVAPVVALGSFLRGPVSQVVEVSTGKPIGEASATAPHETTKRLSVARSECC